MDMDKLHKKIFNERKAKGLFVQYIDQDDSGQNKLTPSKDRWKTRSETYAGIAQAMAEQWSKSQ